MTTTATSPAAASTPAAPSATTRATTTATATSARSPATAGTGRGARRGRRRGAAGSPEHDHVPVFLLAGRRSNLPDFHGTISRRRRIPGRRLINDLLRLRWRQRRLRSSCQLPPAAAAAVAEADFAPDCEYDRGTAANDECNYIFFHPFQLSDVFPVDATKD
ncbi:ABC transporter [Striga asiatica]|uniref:ABC transporter n=1 Tax=Striga asiatica TaxID=4170 RepID=A0A5A7RC75_STRAF|nr:ABC transporter [Striga asiatica]